MSASRLAEKALRLAVSQVEPDISRLTLAVPAILAESRRRRLAEATPAAQVVTVARFWMPRLAAVTALLVIAALMWPHGASRGTTTLADESTSLDAYLLTGSAPVASDLSDPVLSALVR